MLQAKSTKPITSNALADLERDRREYAKQWATVNSKCFHQSGVYDWMCEQVRGHDHILEVGVGSGIGTVSLLERKHRVVGIDENPECLTIAALNLGRSGFSVKVQMRGRAQAARGHTYRVRYQAFRIPTDFDAFLFEGDVSGTDQYLYDALKSYRKFDAIVCWLIGRHKSSKFNASVPEKIRHVDAFTYGIYLQECVYRLADAFLAENGVLSFVDRGKMPADLAVAAQAILSVHRMHAEGTALVPTSVAWKQYKDPFIELGLGVEMKTISDGAIEIAPKGEISTLIAVTARKAGGLPPALDTA